MPCNKNHLLVVDNFRNNHDPDFTSCLNCKAFFNALIRSADLLKLLKSLDVAFVVLASCSRSCSRDSVSSLYDAGNDSFRLNIVMMCLNSVDNHGTFVVFLTYIYTDLNV